jgi:tRNA(adenine34) deaminase
MWRSADVAPAGSPAGAGDTAQRRPAPGGGTGFEQAMRLAIAEAERGGETDVPVGAVILDASKTVIARAANRKEADGDPTAHAELLALRLAARAVGGWRLIGCTLVVTLEPCTMCAGAVTASRVDRLVFGAADPKAGAVGSLWDVVSDMRLNHRPEIIGGVLADECGALLRRFFANRRRPGRGPQP